MGLHSQNLQLSANITKTPVGVAFAQPSTTICQQNIVITKLTKTLVEDAFVQANTFWFCICTICYNLLRTKQCSNEANKEMPNHQEHADSKNLTTSIFFINAQFQSLKL